MSGAKRDVLILLLATASVAPAFTALKMSPILGFLLTGGVADHTINSWGFINSWGNTSHHRLRSL